MRADQFSDVAFNYEDGILAGLIAAQVALRARVSVGFARAWEI